MNYADFVTQVFQEQLGRDPKSEGLTYYTNLLSTGQATPEQIEQEINRSVEGQNFDTQTITSQFRSLLGRNPEQEGYQYWLSVAQDTGATFDELKPWIISGTQSQDQAALEQALSQGYFTNLALPSFESDPYAGRYTNVSRYLTDASAYPNVSYIGDKMYQFMSPITQQPVISKYAPQTWEAVAGLDVLSAPQVDAAINLAFQAGTIDQQDYENLYNDLAQSKSMDDVYAAFNKPQAQVVIDALYGFQTGEGKTLAEAQAEAAIREPYVQQFGFAPSNLAVADVLQRAGVEYPFTYEQMQQMGALYTPENVVTDENFVDQLNRILGTMQMSFGLPGDVATPLSTEYYSEFGLEPEFTPFAEGPTFRSGVAGYTENLPTGFQFGVPQVVAPINTGPQGFQPGIFNQFAESYSQSGVPLDSGGRPLAQFDAMGNPIAADTIYNFNPANFFAGYRGQIFPSQAEAQASFPDTGGGS